MRKEEAQVLRMVEQGVIRPEDGVRLLGAIRKRAGPMPVRRAAAPGAVVRVAVYEGANPAPRVNVRVPLALARRVLGMLPPDVTAALQHHGLLPGVLDGLAESVADHGSVRLVTAEREGARVEIIVE